MKPYVFIVIAVLSLIAVIIFVQRAGIQCSDDSDCIPDACCHATQCAAKEVATNCSGISCTEECKPDTLDCGQGSCICEKGMCKVNWTK